MPDSQGLSLQTRNLNVRYGGVVANADISLSVPPGKIVGLIGPNGAGKTTLVDAVTGFAEYSGSVSLGSVSLDGMASHERRRAGLSRTWQSGELFANLTVTQNVEAAARWGGPGPLIKGSVMALGEPVRAQRAYQLARRGVRFVPDDRGIFFGLSVRDHLGLTRRRPNREREALLFERFPALQPLQARQVGLLSGGEPDARHRRGVALRTQNIAD